MPTFERGALVRVPFPYTNRPIQQRRPAVVVSTAEFADRVSLLWVVMVTSAENRPWPGDISLADIHASVGLPAPSIIRPAKLATIDATIAEPLGTLPKAYLDQLQLTLRENLGF